MAAHLPPSVPLGDEAGDVALQHSPWRKRAFLSSMLDKAETFLAGASLDKGPWLAVAFAAGIAGWFVLGGAAQWVATGALGLIAALAAVALWKGNDERTHLMIAVVTVSLLVSAGVGLA